MSINAGSSNGRTAPFEGVNAGSTPAPATKPESTGQYLIRLGVDMLLWATALIAVGFLHGAGLIENQGLDLAGSALFLAIRVNSKIEANAIRKRGEG